MLTYKLEFCNYFAHTFALSPSLLLTASKYLLFVCLSFPTRWPDNEMVAT